VSFYKANAKGREFYSFEGERTTPTGDIILTYLWARLRIVRCEGCDVFQDRRTTPKCTMCGTVLPPVK
jgi:hypothetical protein